MDPVQIIWDRLVNYREELTDICESVSMELSENRQKREAWQAYTFAWKQIWLKAASIDSNNHENPS